MLHSHVSFCLMYLLVLLTKIINSSAASCLLPSELCQNRGKRCFVIEGISEKIWKIYGFYRCFSLSASRGCSMKSSFFHGQSMFSIAPTANIPAVSALRILVGSIAASLPFSMANVHSSSEKPPSLPMKRLMVSPFSVFSRI